MVISEETASATLSEPPISQQNYNVQIRNSVLKRIAPFFNVYLNIFSSITIIYFQNNFEQKASCALQNTKILSNLNLPATSPFTANTTTLTQPNRLLTPSLASGNLWNNSPLSISDISIVSMSFTKSAVATIQNLIMT